MLTRFFTGYREHPIRIALPLVLGLLSFGLFTLVAFAATGAFRSVRVDLPEELPFA